MLNTSLKETTVPKLKNTAILEKSDW